MIPPSTRHWIMTPHEFAKKVADAVSIMLNGDHISEKNAIYLTLDQPKAGRFYLLPKIHKAGNPGHPIVSANGHHTEKISEFVDLHLQPHVQNLPSYLQDTTDFLRKQDARVLKFHIWIPRSKIAHPYFFLV